MALSKIDVANMLTGATPVANGGTALTSGFVNGKDPRPDAKPLIINGNMAVAQRGTSFTSPGDAEYTLDRFNTNKSHDGAVTITQETLSSGNAYTDGFKNALKIDVTTVDTSLGSSQRLLLVQKIEAQNLQVLKFGTSNAKKMTLAFWVKATKTGTNVVRMYAPDDDRSCSISYTISSSNTWEHKVLNFPADTTGVIDDDNGSGIDVGWGLSAGSGFTSGTLATTWASNTSANDFVGQVNHLDSTSNNFHITGVQLEVGEFSSTTLPPFQHEDFGDNLSRCCRYFFFTGDGSVYQHHGTGVEASSTAVYINIPLPSILRSAPSVSKEDSMVAWDGNSENAVTGLGNTYYSAKGSIVNQAVTCSGGGIDDTAGITVYSNADSSSGFLIDAEL